MIAYLLNEDELSHTQRERQALTHFRTHFQSNLQHLYQKLKKRGGLTELGLLYLACHGIFTDRATTTVYGSWRNPSQRFIPLDLERLCFHDLEARPVLFVNACHSARVQKLNNKLHGLPVVMLTRVASGYVGTLGPVGSAYASQIAFSMLDSIRANRHQKDSQPAHLLRKLRAKAAAQLAQEEDSLEKQLQFIYTFMYVYYGNPHIQLTLLPAPTAGDNHD